MKNNHLWGAIVSLLLMVGAAQNAAAQHIGLMTEGSTNNAPGNVAYFVSQNPSYTWESVNNATLNAMTVAEMNSTFDIIIVPWQINSSLDMDWDTRVLPYLTAGGNILWEDPTNANDGDLAASGLGLSSGNLYTSSDISLVPPYDSNGAEGYYHVHFSITSHNSDWSPFSMDANGGVHGVVGSFGAGRMVLGVSDNLYHADFSSEDTDPAQAAYYNFFLNETQFVITGSVNGSVNTIPTLPQWSMIALVTLIMLFGLLGMLRLRRAEQY